MEKQANVKKEVIVKTIYTVTLPKETTGITVRGLFRTQIGNGAKLVKDALLIFTTGDS